MQILPTLNLQDLKLDTSAMFIIHIKSHVTSYNGPTDIVIKLKDKQNFHTATVLFCILHKINLAEVPYAIPNTC
jgi:hypothetical protein